ncbi:hypothetical protein QE152_g36275 [Popillia japonica]|uniref:Uncharacterized protein n=1 Tax=Popillia japonica TaxID=7064 RepID=A0AAW1ID82_POPJA
MPTETTVEKPKQQLGMGSVYGPPALYNINALIDVCPDSVSIDKISDDDIYEALKQYGPPALYNINALIDVCPDSVSIDKISDDDIYEALKQLHSMISMRP